MLSEQEIKDIIVSQYYLYLKLFKITNNFTKDINLYQQLNFDAYNSLTIIGSILQIQKITFQAETLYVPILKTPLLPPNTDITVPISLLNRVQRKLIISGSSYKSHLAKTTNTMLKNKQFNYAITHLKPMFYNNNLFFAISSKSYIIQIQDQYYKSNLLPLEKFKDFSYSRINMFQLYTPNEMENLYSEGMILQNLKQRLTQKDYSQRIAAVGGIVTHVNYDSKKQNNSNFDNPRNHNSKREKEMEIFLIQDYLGKSKKNQYIGAAKVIIRYFPQDFQEINALIQPNYLLIFTHPDIIISETCNINFKINNFKNHQIIRLSKQPRQTDLQIYAKTLQLSTFDIYGPSYGLIQRNYRKFRVVLDNCEIIYAKYFCEQCGKCIISKSVQSYDMFYVCNCETKKGEQKSKLQLWAIATVVDETGPAYISIQDTLLLQFFDLQEYIDRIKQVLKTSTNSFTNKGTVIYRSNKNKIFSPNELNDISTKIKYTYIEKDIVGYPRFDLQKAFKGTLNQEEKIQFQISFINSRKLIQTKKINPNGLLEKNDKRNSQDNSVVKLMPMIKVKYVEDSLKSYNC